MEDFSKQQIKKLLQDVTEIKDYLLGTAYNKKGLVERVDILEQQMLDLQLLRAKIVGISVILAAIISTIIPIILKVLWNV